MSSAPQSIAKSTADLVERLKRQEEAKMIPPNGTVTPTLGAGRMVADRLARKFGYGTDENRRRQLYERLEHEVELHGDVVYVIISDVVQAAMNARSPSRWFCKSVILRLRERGYLRMGDHADW